MRAGSRSTAATNHKKKPHLKLLKILRGTPGTCGSRIRRNLNLCLFVSSYYDFIVINIMHFDFNIVTQDFNIINEEVLSCFKHYRVLNCLRR